MFVLQRDKSSQHKDDPGLDFGSKVLEATWQKILLIMGGDFIFQGGELYSSWKLTSPNLVKSGMLMRWPVNLLLCLLSLSFFFFSWFVFGAKTFSLLFFGGEWWGEEGVPFH